MNYKNVKFAVDHLVFGKIIDYINSIIGSIVNKIKSVIEKFTNVENQVLEITDDNWADYITPRPKAVGVDVKNGYSIDKNPINCGKLIICFRTSNYFYSGDNPSSNYKFSLTKLNEILNRELTAFKNGDYIFGKLFPQLYLLKDEAVGISNNRELSQIHGQIQVDYPETIIFNGQLKLSSNIQKVIFNCKYINFVNLSILPGEFKINNSEKTNDVANSNYNLNGRTIILLQNSDSGVDLSTFTITVKNDNLDFTSNQRIVSLDRRNCYIQALSTGEKISNEYVKIENWGGLDTDSTNINTSYGFFSDSELDPNKYRLTKFDFFKPMFGTANSYSSTTSDDGKKTEDPHPNCPSLNESAAGNDGNEEIVLSDNLFGIFGTGLREKYIIPRLRPGRAVELVWYNGYWYAK